MQSSTCIFWNVASISKTSSRIPHLNYHLLRRQSRRLAEGACNAIPQSQRRPHSTALDLSQYVDDSHETASVSRAHQIGKAPRSKSISRTIEQSNDNVGGLGILGEDNPDRLLFALLDESIGKPFITYSSNEDFERVFLALDPDHFIEPYKSIYRTLRNITDSGELPGMKSIEERFEEFSSHIDYIVATRRQADIRLTLPVCQHILRCASSMGNAKLATEVLDSLMVTDNVKPDLTCYNYYLHARNWNHAFSKAESLHLRVTTGNLDRRRTIRSPERLFGHKASNPQKNISGIRADVLGIFKQLIDKQMVADEFTFVNLMTAMGREGDLDGAKSVLKSVWNIDVNLLAAYDEEELESPTFYEDDSPLRPTERLLSLVVHTFGSNNDVQTAWTLMDYISRNYNLTIPRQTWIELIEWTFLLSLRRSTSQKMQGRAAGQVPPEALVQMVQVMMDAPHNIDPSVYTHALLARSWRERRHLGNTVSQTDAAIRLFEDQTALIAILVEEVLNMVADPSVYRTDDGFLSPRFHSLRHLFIKESLEFENCKQMINKSVKNNLLTETDYAGSGRYTEWHRRVLPTLVEKYTQWLPDTFRYSMASGTVEIECKIHRVESHRGRRARLTQAVKLILAALDTEDHAKLLTRAAQLREFVSHKQTYCERCHTTEHSPDLCPRLNVPMWTPRF